MASSILSLPLELLLSIVDYLNLADFVSLLNARRALAVMLSYDGICSRFAQDHIQYSTEARRAQEGILSYRSGIQYYFERREAFALCNPVSANVLGYGSSFVYREGVLCYLRNGVIRLMDVHAGANTETVIDYQRYLRRRAQLFGQIESIHFADGFLSFVHDPGPEEERVELVAIDTRNKSTPRRFLKWCMARGSRYFVRHTSRYLYYGLCTGNAVDSHQEWRVSPFDLSNGSILAAFQLTDFVGADIGSNVVFEIMDGYFYALSNQTTLEAQEEDPTSYYRILRFPIDDPRSERMEQWLQWRRNHQEGPIHDSWTDIALHKNERTGTLEIVETRAEWQNGQGSSKLKRTFYTEPVIPPLSSNSAVSETSSVSAPSTPIFATTTISPEVSIHSTSSSSASQTDPPTIDIPITAHSPPHARLPHTTHPEYATPLPPLTYRSFLLSKTKHRAYHPGNAAFLDLVLDSTPPSSHPKLQQQVRLRIGSRVQAHPFVGDDSHALLRKPDIDQDTGLSVEGSEEQFVDRGIRIWPPLDAPAELINLLNLGLGTSSDVEAQSDERSVVYMAGTGSGSSFRDGARGCDRPIVLLNFDPFVRFQGLRRLGGEENVPNCKRSSGGVISAEAVAVARTVADNAPWYRRERAMWADIDRGFRLR